MHVVKAQSSLCLAPGITALMCSKLFTERSGEDS